MIKTDFLQQLDRFSLILDKKVNSNYAGEKESLVTGHGLIFKDHKEYVAGDDYRNIDWRVFARSDKLFIKRFEEERNLTVHIIVDFSGSMDFGSKKVSKAEYASMLGIGFAYMAMKGNEKFVLSTFSEELEFFVPRKGKKQLVAMVDYLNSKKPKGLSKLGESLKQYKKRINSRSLIVIISDCLYDTEDIKQSLMRYKSHDIILIQVLDDKERDLKYEGEFKLQDSETNAVIKTFISPFLRRSYKKKMNSHIATINNICSQLGIHFFTVNSSTPIFDTFYKILMQKQKFRY